MADNKQITLVGSFVESEISDPQKELARRLKKDGYLFFRNVVPILDIQKAKRVALKLGFAANLLSSRYKNGFTQINKALTNVDEMAFAAENFVSNFTKSKAFNSILLNKSISGLLEKILASPVVKHPSPISQWARVHLPESLFPRMLPHQDFNYIGQPVETYSVWVPLMDCPQRLGPLSILNGSHRYGYQDHGLMKQEAQIPKNLKKWLSIDFNIGDILIFHSYSIHGALPNRTKDIVRLALDLRFCKKIFNKI